MLPGGFFLQQRVKMDFAGFAQIDSLELIGYDPDSGAFKSNVFSNMSPEPLPYTWDIDDGSLTISVSYGALDATYKGQFRGPQQSLRWLAPQNPSADETVNVPYDIAGTRLE